MDGTWRRQKELGDQGSKGSGMEGVAGGGSGRVPGKHEGGDSFPEIGKSI